MCSSSSDKQRGNFVFFEEWFGFAGSGEYVYFLENILRFLTREDKILVTLEDLLLLTSQQLKMPQ